MAVIMPANASNRLQSLLFGKLIGVEKHEYAAVGWSFAYFFCVLSAYYIIRPIRETMGVGSGPNTLPWLFFATFVTMLIVTPMFGWVASRYARRQFLPWVYLFFIANIIIFWIVFSNAVNSESDHIWLGRVFFVWISIFNLFVVSVFWSFMAEIYTREQGRRLFGFITSGGSIGAVLGGVATSYLAVRIGFQNVLPIAAGMLLLAIFCIKQLRKQSTQDSEETSIEAIAKDRPLGGNPFAGITHVFSSKFFSAIVLKSIIASLLGTALYMFTARLVEVSIPDTNEQTQFFSNINNWTNLLAFIGQMLVVKQVVQRFGVGVSMTLLPIASVAGFLLLAVEPTLAVVALVTVMRRALGFGFSKPTTDMLYSVVTPEEKYKTKNFIDTAVYRAGDVVGILGIRGLFALGMGIPGISVIMLPFAALWGSVSLWLGRDYRRRAKQLRESEAR